MHLSLQFCYRVLLALFLTLVSYLTSAQNKKSENSENKIYTYVEQMPVFSGGEKGMMEYLGQNIKYNSSQPKGKVILSFVVNTDKNITDVHLIKSLSPELDEECKRVVESMSGQWTSGVQNGKPVAVRFILPINFDKPVLTDQGLASTQTPASYSEEMPDYKTGMAQFLKFVNKNKKYNKSISPEGISQISFIVNEDGSLSDYKVVKSLSPELDQEAIRVLTLTSGNWKPGRQNGKPVKVRFTVPVRF